MNGWAEAIQFTLKWEGGFVDDPDDPGGVTNFGISQRSHPDVDVRNLTREQAQAIYYDAYWLRLQAHKMPGPVAVALFDFAVHSGVRFAAKRLQRVLGVEIDGTIGPKTLDAVLMQDAVELATELTMARARYQSALIRASPNLLRFFGGWSARLVDLTATFARLPS